MALKFKKGAETIYTSELWYDILEGGYIQPQDLLEGDDAEEVRRAITLVQQFAKEAEKNSLIEIG